MSEHAGERPWPKPRLRPERVLIGLLLLAILLFEWQRTDAMAKAHRERMDQSYRIEAIDRKVDWLLLTQPSTGTELKLRPSPALGSSAGRR